MLYNEIVSQGSKLIYSSRDWYKNIQSCVEMMTKNTRYCIELYVVFIVHLTHPISTRLFNHKISPEQYNYFKKVYISKKSLQMKTTTTTTKFSFFLISKPPIGPLPTFGTNSEPYYATKYYNAQQIVPRKHTTKTTIRVTSDGNTLPTTT